MNIPYRTRRTLGRFATIAMVVLVVGLICWLCWIVWLQRYVVYTDDGATLDFSQSSYGLTGAEAKPPVAESKVSIYYNEGADAVSSGNEMTQLSGYYITSDMFQKNMEVVKTSIERLPVGTAVMIDMKGPYGSFFYDSQLPDAVISQSTNIEEVTALVKRLQSKGFYTIARVSAYRDRSFGDTHVSSGLYMLNRAGLWMDPNGMYWLNPTSATVTNWISSVVLELRGLGFNEVVLDDFCFPDSTQYIFNDDKDAALASAAQSLMDQCAASDFVLSFCMSNAAFTLPEGRCRLYISGIDAATADSKAAVVTFSDPDIRLVFLADTGDTRYDKYSVLRTIEVSEEVEARKSN